MQSTERFDSLFDAIAYWWMYKDEVIKYSHPIRMDGIWYVTSN